MTIQQKQIVESSTDELLSRREDLRERGELRASRVSLHSFGVPRYTAKEKEEMVGIETVLEMRMLAIDFCNQFLQSIAKID